MRCLLLSTLLLALASSQVLATPYAIDPAHTNVTFTAPHLVISKVKGRFDKFSGSFEYDEKTQQLDKVEVTIKTTSINTNEADRDKHLRSPDFFDVVKFPEMKFVSTKVIYNNSKPDKVEGILSIRGVKKPVTLDVEYKGAITDAWGNRVIAFEVEGTVNRKDFGMIWNKALDKGGVTVGDEIKIDIDGEAKIPTAKK